MDQAVAIVMAYTGWSRQNAEAAVEQWRWFDPTWDAAHILGYLTPKERAWVEQVFKEVGGVGAIAPIRSSTCANEGRGMQPGAGYACSQEGAASAADCEKGAVGNGTEDAQN